MTASKKLFVRTFGCQMNVYDSGRMVDVLAARGYETTETPEDADLVILNTCHIREKAAEKVFSEIGRIRALKEERAARGQSTMIGVAGCVAQAEGEEIVRRAPVVDLVVGPQAYHRLPELLDRATRGEMAVDTDFPPEDKFTRMPASSERRVRTGGATAFLAVQEGCDKFCTFCVVPYTRGAEQSRPARALIEEARRLVERGVKEITLLGQNVNAYHGEGIDGREWGLARLLYALAEIEGLQRLRYTTSHPRDMDEDLIAAHRDLDVLMPYLHLPVQSGSDRLLKAMNRRHTRDTYFDIIERVRAARPDIAISGDFIVGFPGETEADFDDTLDLVKRVAYAQAFSFKYSARPGTPASEMGDQVAEDVKAERLQRLQAALVEGQQTFNQGLVGRTMPVMFEKPGRRAGQLIGRSPYLIPVHAEVPASMMGEIVEVAIESAGPNSLGGRLRPAVSGAGRPVLAEATL